MDLGDEEEIRAVLADMALAGDGLFLGLSFAVIAIRIWLKFAFQYKALNLLKGTPSPPHISDLRLLLEDHSEHTNKQSISSASSSIRDNPLVMVRGKVSAKSFMEAHSFRIDDGLLSTENPTSEEGVIVQRTQTCLYNEWRGLFGWSSDWRILLGRVPLKKQITVSLRKVPFVLVDDDVINFDAFVNIDIDDSKHDLPLTKVYHQLHPVQSTPYTLLQAIFGRGYPVGILDEEQILPIGKEITAVGILDKNVDGQPIIKSSKQLPYFLTELTKEQLMIELATNTKVLLWTAVIIGSCAAGVLGYAFYRNWRRYNEWRLDRERQHEHDRLSAEQMEQDRLLEEQMEQDRSDVPVEEHCIICLQRRRTTAFLPCGHWVCCILCAHIVQDNDSRCPVCRQDSTSIVRIYES